MKNSISDQKEAAMRIDSSEATQKAFLTVLELARRWECCVESIRRDIRARRLQSVYRNGKHLTSLKEIARVESESTLPTK